MIASNYTYVQFFPGYATNCFEIQQIINRLTARDRCGQAPTQLHAYSMEQ